ncbi:hypothetical protein CPB84DRAFT_1683322 [Gymnopilus junonius]|uniref:Uncharacterized protein n=1 Tax=Gymnopilus junonius TaxID=109634 RepID=A0A9P5TKA9_GYMJU|nr:hypothetical protein CPB84DRAFT_1683322 [Gymnopilus junonius]
MRSDSGGLNGGFEREEQAKWLEKERQDWARERAKEERILEEERRADEERRQSERREKERKERQKKEEEDRKRDAIAWTDFEVGHCLRYGIREYSAVISQVPVGFDSVEECRKKPISIHGREWLPSSCNPEDQCPSGRVTGHWEIDIDEVTCRPYWDSFNDKGCLETGIRRYKSHLMNVQDYTHWEAVCITAPADINGRHYDGPNSCEKWAMYGILGIWHIQDDTCR